MSKIAEVAVKAAVCLTAAASLSACTSTQKVSSTEAKAKSTQLASTTSAEQKAVYSYTTKDRECLKRAMYFESKRTSENGFIAVGSVVMNRLTSGIYPSTICGVVAQEKQFAPGVMSRKMDEETAPALNTAADAVLKGARHPDVKSAMFFHTKGLTFPYRNMHYVASAGGNVFYEKRGRDGELQTAEPKPVDSYVLAYASGNNNAPGAAIASAAAPASQIATTAGAAVSGSGPTDIQPQQSPAFANQPSLAPVITAAVARASMDQAFDTAYSVPQNSSVTPAMAYTVGLASDMTVPVPATRPEANKRSGAGVVMAEPSQQHGTSQENWLMRTSDWQ